MTIPVALKKLSDAVRVRRYSLHTEKAYLMWLRSYIEAVLQTLSPRFSDRRKLELCPNFVHGRHGKHETGILLLCFPCLLWTKLFIAFKIGHRQMSADLN
jgi:hypothetical protein